MRLKLPFGLLDRNLACRCEAMMTFVVIGTVGILLQLGRQQDSVLLEHLWEVYFSPSKKLARFDTSNVADSTGDADRNIPSFAFK